jgi:hypothetical protein
LLGLAEAIAFASPARREELCSLLIEKVIVRDRQLHSITWVPAARPFFKWQRKCPQGGSGTRPLSNPGELDEDDPLVWYVA